MDFLSMFGGLFGGNAGGAIPAPQQPDPAMTSFLSFLPNMGQPAPVAQSSSWQRDHSVPADLGEAVMAPFADVPTVATTAAPREAPVRKPYSQPMQTEPTAPQQSSVWDPVELAPVQPETISEVNPYEQPRAARPNMPGPSKLGGPLTKDIPDFAKATRLEAAPRLLRSDPLAVTADSDLGVVSAKYESGGRGVGFISSGKDDPGGKSYGIHQLSGAYSMGAFLRSKEGASYKAAFGGLKPTTKAFNAVYKKIAAADPVGFAKAQREFYTRTHFEPLRAAAEKLGFDVKNRGVQEALFSMSVQHGKAAKIVGSASWAAGAPVRQQINALYAARTNYVARLGTLGRNIKASIANRYRNERRDALRFS